MRRTIFASLLLLLALTAVAGDKSFSYMFNHGKMVISGNVDVSRIQEMRERMPEGEFLWARRDGRQYLISDAATLAEARAAFREADALHAEYERLHAKMRPLERREEALERQIDELEDDDKDASHLRAQLRPVTRELRQLEEEEERIDEQEEKLVDAAEKELLEIVDRAIRRGIAERIR